MTSRVKAQNKAFYRVSASITTSRWRQEDKTPEASRPGVLVNSSWTAKDRSVWRGGNQGPIGEVVLWPPHVRHCINMSASIHKNTCTHMRARTPLWLLMLWLFQKICCWSEEALRETERTVMEAHLGFLDQILYLRCDLSTSPDHNQIRMLPPWFDAFKN